LPEKTSLEIPLGVGKIWMIEHIENSALNMLYAVQGQDWMRIQKLELFCDAVAVVTLLTLHLDPACYCKALKQICKDSPTVKALNDGTGSHPALSVRLKLIDEIWRNCKISASSHL